VRNESEARTLASQIGFPLVAKIASADILHKSDIGGVMLDIHSSDEAVQAFDALMRRAKEQRPNAKLEGVTYQRQIPAGQDVIVGMARDAQFGALIMFGAGGVEVEGLKDVAFALAPLSEREADRLIERTWAGKKLSGFRSIPAADKAAVKDALIKLAQLACDHPEIAEIEINPLRALSQGAVALDIRVKISTTKEDR
jgi:acyl-CoA synthetase (NDP forming)